MPFGRSAGGRGGELGCVASVGPEHRRAGGEHHDRRLPSGREHSCPSVRWWSRRPAVICLAVALCESGALLIALGSHLVFDGDDWNVVLDRRGHAPATSLDPHQGHLVLAVVVVYKLLLVSFGMSSPLPFHAVSTLFYLLAAALMFVYIRRRVGDWLALFATAVILFFGASALDVLSSFQIFFSGAMAAGLGALLALDRGDRRGDVAACLLLAISISFSELGIAFTVGVVVRMALARKPLAGRVYVVLVPLALYGLWWLGWGHNGPSFFSLHNVATTPAYVFNAVSTAVGALLGITSSGNQAPAAVGQQWAPVLLVAALALGAWRLWRLGRVPRGVWPVLAIGLTFWVLAGFNQSDFRLPDNARYLYPSGVFILLIASELLRGVRPGTLATMAVAGLTAIAVAANLAFLSDNYSFRKHQSEANQGLLRVLEIAGPVNPAYDLPLGLAEINARTYLLAVRDWGSPAYTDSELALAPEKVRVDADRTLAAMLGLKLQPGGSVVGPCRTVQASTAEGSSAVPVGTGRITVMASGSGGAEIKLGRFSAELPIDSGAVAPGRPASLTIPVDRSAREWRLEAQGQGPLRVCGPGVSPRSS